MKIKYVNNIGFCCVKMKDNMQMARILCYDGKLIFNRHLPSGDILEEEILYCPFCGQKVEIDYEENIW